MVLALDGKHILMVIAPVDFHEEELLETNAVFAAEGAIVEIASTAAGTVRGMLGAEVRPDVQLSDLDTGRYAAVVLMGGRGAPAHLWGDDGLHGILRRAHAKGATLGAICLAPGALARAGLLKGVRVTACRDSLARHELARGGAVYVDDDIIVDGRIVTASGPHAARAFATALVRTVTAPEWPHARYEAG